MIKNISREEFINDLADWRFPETMIQILTSEGRGLCTIWLEDNRYAIIRDEIHGNIIQRVDLNGI